MIPSMMNRRRFLHGSSVGVLAAPHAVDAHPAGKVYRIGLPTGDHVTDGRVIPK
jgi:hypothetical protein